MSDSNPKLPTSSGKLKENESNHPGTSATSQVVTTHPHEDDTSILSFLVKPRPANTNESRNDARLRPGNVRHDGDNQSIMSLIVSKPAVKAETTDRPIETHRPRKESQEKESILSFLVSKPKPVPVPPENNENKKNSENSKTVKEAAKPLKNEKVKTNKARELPAPLKEKREHTKDFSILEGFARFFTRNKKEASPTESVLLKTYEPSFVDGTVQTSEVTNDPSTTSESLGQAIEKLQRLHSMLERMMKEIRQGEDNNESSDKNTNSSGSPEEGKLKGKESVEEILPSRNATFSVNSSREESAVNSTELVMAQNAPTLPSLEVPESDHEAGPRSVRSQGDRLDFNDPHVELLDDKQLDGKEPAGGIKAQKDDVEESADKHSDKIKSPEAGTNSMEEILPSRNATFSVLSSKRESAVNSTELVTAQNAPTLPSPEVPESTVSESLGQHTEKLLSEHQSNLKGEESTEEILPSRSATFSVLSSKRESAVNSTELVMAQSRTSHSSRRESAVSSAEQITKQKAQMPPFKVAESRPGVENSSGNGRPEDKNDARKPQSNLRGEESNEKILPGNNALFSVLNSKRESSETGKEATKPPKNEKVKTNEARELPAPLKKKQELTKDFSILEGFARFFTGNNKEASPTESILLKTYEPSFVDGAAQYPSTASESLGQYTEKLLSEHQSNLKGEESMEEILPSRNATFSVLSSKRESAVNSTELVMGQNDQSLPFKKVTESDRNTHPRSIRSQLGHIGFNDSHKKEIVDEVLSIIRGEMLGDKHLNLKESSERAKAKKAVEVTTQTEDRLYSYRILRNACFSFGCHCNERESDELVTSHNAQTMTSNQVTESDHEADLRPVRSQIEHVNFNEPHMKEEIVAEVLTIIRGQIVDDKHLDSNESSEETKGKAEKEGVDVSIQTEYRRFPYRPEDYGLGLNPNIPNPLPTKRPFDCRRPASCADCKVEVPDQTQFCNSFSGNNVRCGSTSEPPSNCFCPHPQSPIINVEWANNQSVGDNAAVPLQEAFKRFHTVCYQRVCMRQQSIANSKRRRELYKTAAEARCPCPCPQQNRHNSASAKPGRRGGRRSSLPGAAKGSQKRGTELVSTDRKCECKEDPCEPFTYVVPKDQVYWQWI